MKLLADISAGAASPFVCAVLGWVSITNISTAFLMGFAGAAGGFIFHSIRKKLSNFKTKNPK